METQCRLFDVIHYGYSLVIDGEFGTLSIPIYFSMDDWRKPALRTDFDYHVLDKVLRLYLTGTYLYLLRQHPKSRRENVGPPRCSSSHLWFILGISLGYFQSLTYG